MPTHHAPAPSPLPRRPPSPRRRQPASPPIESSIEAIQLQGSVVRGSRPVMAWVHVAGGGVSQLEVFACTPGFRVVWAPRSATAAQVLLTLRITRTVPTRRRLCLLRFQAGGSSAAASITVLDD